MENPSVLPHFELRRRELREDLCGRAVCWDLYIEDADGCCLLPDVASGRRGAEALLQLFTENTVGSINAPDVMEDLLSTPEMLDLLTDDRDF